MISACLQLIDNTAILFAALKSGRPKDSHVNEDPYGEHQKRYKDDRGHKPRSNALSTSVAILLMEFSCGSFFNATIRLPLPLTVPAWTGDSRPLATGKASPVIIDSSTSEPPCRTMPSVTILDSGVTLKWSPYCNRRASMRQVCGLLGDADGSTRSASST
jgi:hypothetical protein